MQKIMIFLGLLFLSAQAFSQRSLKGTVYSENYEPLTGATVVINPGNHGTTTDQNGEFFFTGISTARCHITISFIGYRKWERDIDLRETNQLKVIMEPASHLTEEVVVTAYRAGQQTPVAHTDIDGEVLRSTGVGNDIPSLLKLTPSLVTTSESGIGLGYTNLRIRGTDPTRINVTMNGVPLNDSESQGVFWANMPDFANSVENVQIQRGVGTSTQGSAAFGASINFQTTTSDPQSYAELTSTVGSFNTFKNSLRFGTGLINDKFSFEGRYSRLKSDGYIKNAFSDHQSLYLGGTMHFDNSFLKMIILHGDQQTGISWWGVPQEMLETDRRYNPAGVYTDEFGNEQYYDDQTDNYKQTHAQLFYSWALNTEFHATAALHYTRGDGFYEQYKEDEDFVDYGLSAIQISDQTIETSDLIRRKWMGNDFYGATLSGDLKLSSQSNLTFGGGWNRYDGDHFGRIIWMRYAGTTEKDYEWYFNNGTKTEHNLFAKFDWEASPLLRLFMDIQYRGINYEMSGIDDDLRSLDQEHDFRFFNPKAGFYLTPKDNHSIYAFAGISNREPTRTNFKDANQDPEATPKAERLYDIETGYKYESGTFSGGINLYYMYYEDQLIPTGEKSNVGYDIMTNVDKSYRTGVEVMAAVQPLSWLTWDMNLTLSRNIIKDFVETSTNSYPDPDGSEDWITETVKNPLGDTQIAYSPSVVGSSNLAANITSRFKISLQSKYVGEQYFNNTESDERKLDAWFVNDLQFNWKLNPKPFKSIGLQFTIHNVLDHEYESNAYGGNWYEEDVEKTWAYYYPMAGRYYMGQVVIRF
ncbi:TonB-dependent receptor [Thermophagus xiamenensis]|uniref:Iron complex outermembrane recepter protein n=1 Tax=Thermophagus xiamenensis TaxID=385682 RepID=A0A1I1VJ37_9BACT|nr:TonB-dependent receptor [Thermophagus xiamenensis]SFD82869.1 iron complex outermembrane recepter protein [Thermophagus xiamenensis]